MVVSSLHLLSWFIQPTVEWSLSIFSLSSMANTFYQRTEYGVQEREYAHSAFDYVLPPYPFCVRKSYTLVAGISSRLANRRNHPGH